uniref:BTB domain-containing protein n=1 Tax=Panagrolaimus sp. PS1159 TaxID=55785 RepID=A0AC35FI52_9BILA
MVSKCNNPAFISMSNIRHELFQLQDLQNGLFDVAFSIGGKLLYAHKYILGSASSTLKEKFLLRMRLLNNDPIIIDDCSYADFYNFLTFLYSGSCELNDKNLFSIAEISDKYDVSQLQRRCTDYLTNAKYCSKNFVELYELFNEHPIFRGAFRSGMLKKYPKWLQSSNFLLAKKKTIEAIVAFDRPYKHEDKLFTAVYQWAATRAKHIQRASNGGKNDNPRVQHPLKVEINVDDDCMIIDEVIATPKKSQPSSHDNALYEIIKNELADLLPKFHFNAMTKEFITSYVVERGFIFSYTKLAKIIDNIKKFEVEVTDIAGKKARGILIDQDFVIDEIKNLEDIRSKGHSWELSSKFTKHSNLKFIDAATKLSENIVYLQILRKNGDLYIGHSLDDDFFLAKLNAQKGFTCKDCMIRIV